MIYQKVILVLMTVGGDPTAGMQQIEMPSMEVCEREAQVFRDESAGLGGTRAICITTGDKRE